MWYPLQKNNVLPLVFVLQIAAAHAALPIWCSVFVLFFFPLALFTLCVNETLNIAKPIHLNPFVQTSVSEDRALELPGFQTTPAHLLGHSPCKGLIGEREKDNETDLIGEWRERGNKDKKNEGCGRPSISMNWKIPSPSSLLSLIYPPRAHNAAPVFSKTRGWQEQKRNSIHSLAHWPVR